MLDFLFCSAFCRRKSVATESSVREAENARKSQKIEEELENERTSTQRALKILILGGPESGKSTIFKQMRILHLDGFTPYDQLTFRSLIRTNLIQSLHQLIEGAREFLFEIPAEVKEKINIFDEFLEGKGDFSLELAEIMKFLLETEYLKKAMEIKSEFELMDSADYFLSNFERITASDYHPTHMDILRSRAATTGIIEMEFSFRNTLVRMVDVGGQRTEQRKWIHCFSNCSGILFIVDIASYNQQISTFDFGGRQPVTQATVVETTENKLKYSMRLFKKTSHNPCFGLNTAFVLFLNKTDIFKEKLRKTPITVCFKDYKGPQIYEPCAFYIQERLKHLSKKKEKPYYVHFTNATDTHNIDRVFESCIDVVFKTSMKRAGLM